MLEQVGEAGAAPDLVLRAHVVPDVHGHDRRLAVLVDDDGQAVVEPPQRVGNVHGAGSACAGAGERVDGEEDERPAGRQAGA